MEKWKSRVKGVPATESVLPPTRRPPSPECVPVDKKKDRKWSFGGLLKRISSSQHNDVSSNDEDITYIPGHLLSKKNNKKPSKMKSKLTRLPQQQPILPPPSIEEKSYPLENKDTLELIKSLQANLEKSQDSICPCTDSLNSRSSDGSLDAIGKIGRINRMKARAQAKRNHLCGNSSSDDDSHKSNQSLTKFRSDDNIQNIQKLPDANSRRTRGARTERYIKRLYRDDGTSGSDNKILKPKALPKTTNPTPFQYPSNSLDSNIWKINDSAPKIDISQKRSSPTIVPLSTRINRHDVKFSDHYLRDMNENETFQREKGTWPQSNFRRSTPINEIYGSLRSRPPTVESYQQKLLPPEPPPRSSKPRAFANVYNKAPFAFNNINPSIQQPPRRYLSPPQITNTRSYNSDNEILLSDHAAPTRLRHLWQNSEPLKKKPADLHSQVFYTNENCNSLDRTARTLRSTRNGEYYEEQENCDPRTYYQETIPPPKDYNRSTGSLPKGVQLFSRQRMSHCGDSESGVREDHIIPELRKSREISSCQSPSACSFRTLDDDEAERKRSSKNLEDALSELEAIYNSLRLSDDDLLERAEQRSMEEYRDKAAKNAAEYLVKSCSDASSNEKEEFWQERGVGSLQLETDLRIKDDMAYRRMNPKERPPSVNGQSSLAQISYLATSPNHSGRETDCYDHLPRSRRGTPDLTRDDVLFRSINHANNKLKIIEPQPPFGIPLGPVTTAAESDYLHIKPSKTGQTRSLYIPQTEPDIITDDLAFRNLRKDGTKDSSSAFKKNNNLLLTNDTIIEPRFSPKNTFTFGNKKKRTVRSMSADLYGLTSKETDKPNDWYNEYIQSTKNLRFVPNNVEKSVNYNYKDTGEKFCDTDIFCSKPGNLGLDINGNRPKSALQRKIQVYVPQERSVDVCKQRRLSDTANYKPRDLIKLIGKESEESSPERGESPLSFVSDVYEKNKTIETFTEQEISEYERLRKDLEKLIERTAEHDTKIEESKDSDEKSQSEFDEWEKLLNDYELPVSISAFDEIAEVTSTEKEDEGSSRSLDFLPITRSVDNLESSVTKTDEKIFEDEAFSTSEVDTDSVYDKFNKLLKEVNDVPFVGTANLLNKYSVDEIADETLHDNETNQSITSSSVDEKAKDKIDEESNAEKLEDRIIRIDLQDRMTKENNERPSLRARKTEDRNEGSVLKNTTGFETKIDCKIRDDETTSYREGEKIEDERACNDEAYAFKDSMHLISKLCHVTNRITAYHIVLCWLFLTLLITIILAQ